MPGRQPRRENVSSEQEMTQIEELKSQINKLQKDNPNVREGLIRELYKKISEITKENVKEQLLCQLKQVSDYGLNLELRTLVKESGLNMEALNLVLNYLTSKEELARHFFIHRKEAVKNGDLHVIRRRLGPKLEVLGGLSAKGIDVTKDWVTNLVKMAPSLQSLSRISVRELEVRKVVHELNDSDAKDTVRVKAKLKRHSVWRILINVRETKR